ncbi:RNA polymerase sigma factor RpoD [Lachnospiraceae bacterium KM106-2]|nr:RNA polymerase sigma factor RpoD [Lachnospiraceae bacterium KM106-2]
MLDKVTFMETLRSVAEIAKTSPEPLKREEVDQYFEGMDLSKEQREMVYQYLLNPVEEETKEEETTPESDQEATETVENKNEKLSDSAFFQMYMEDLNELDKYTVDEVNDMFQKLQSGNEEMIAKLSDYYLPKVIDLAKQYQSRTVNMEDVIQEGNIGLLYGLKQLAGDRQVTDAEGYLIQSIKESMEQFIDEMANEGDWENTVVAKANLVYEAQKILAEQMGRVPSNEELAEYTKLSLNEIDDIVGLFKKESSSTAKEESKNVATKETTKETMTETTSQDMDTPWSDFKYDK